MINRNRRFLEMAMIKKVLPLNKDPKIENVMIKARDVKTIFEELFRANKIKYK